MKLKKLTEEEFEATFIPPMVDITSSATQIQDIWPDVFKVLENEYSQLDTNGWDVEYVYKGASEKYQHVLINTGMENIYLVIVLVVSESKILGHHYSNLNVKYGLTN